MRTKKDMAQLLEKLQHYLSVEENVYGKKIARVQIKDTLYAATKTTVEHYPGTDDVYKLVDRVSQTLKEQNVVQTGPPIVNITDDGDSYQLMVALPTNKRIIEKGAVFFRYMVPGYFLTTKVIGGPTRIANAAQTVQQYIKDKKKVAMAIPFNAYITNRNEVTDSINWITQLYFPIAH